jgi:tetratricopeptide (TPR) repeat protein
VRRLGHQPGSRRRVLPEREHLLERALALASLLIVSLIAALATTARADPLGKPNNALAREHLATGNRFYRVREFEKAVEEYKAGAVKEDAPVFYYNLGQCYRQLGRYEDAIWHYERFLDRGKPTGNLEASVRKFIAQMKAELERAAMKQPPVEPAPPPASSPPERPGPLSAAAAPVTITRSGRWYEDAFGWGLAGTGAVAAGAAGLMFLSASRFNDRANREPNQQAQEELHDKADTRQLLGTVIAAGAGALIVTGVLKLVINDDGRPARTSVGVGRGGLTVFVRF